MNRSPRLKFHNLVSRTLSQESNGTSMIMIYFISILLFSVIFSMDVFYVPGGLEDYIKMTRHPGDQDLNELSVCMRSV